MLALVWADFWGNYLIDHSFASWRGPSVLYYRLLFMGAKFVAIQASFSSSNNHRRSHFLGQSFTFGHLSDPRPSNYTEIHDL